MKKRLFYPALWGTLLILLFYGCRTNEDVVKKERQIQGSEYSSKTLWNEDEKYIKNVIKIYDQYKETVIKSTQIKGEPFWDYAMTMGQFNESYLEVPIVNQEKVVQILRVIRKGSQVYFGSNSEEKTSMDFFQQLIFGKYTTINGEEERKGKVQNTGNGALADGQYICTTRKISMWYPDDNNNPDGSGHWETYYESRCLWVEQDKTDIIVPCVGPGCDGGGDPGGGTPGFPYPEPLEDLCSKAKAATIQATEYSKTSAFQDSKTGVSNSYVNNGSKGEFGSVFGLKNGTIESTPVQVGNSNGHSATLTHNFTEPVGDLHNHPGSNPPSMGDLYNMIDLNNYFSSFKYRYVLTDDGTMYALIITDSTAANIFKQNYPPVITADPTGGKYTTFPQKLLDEWNDLRMTFSDSGALAYVLDKYNSGVTLAKMDSAGNFRKINITEVKNADGSIDYKYALCP
ncbi:hypothetical protein HZP94_15095 [Elizabethkingia anophelis]|nr:hypothetical protein [Elizabethkingia anophelis]MCT4063688.1 hypothetical protein [Elizabethkingia anophelis]MCT4109962.1 hypothetical protein [Elizabethkingia anophelis]